MKEYFVNDNQLTGGQVPDYLLATFYSLITHQGTGSICKQTRVKYSTLEPILKFITFYRESLSNYYLRRFLKLVNKRSVPGSGSILTRILGSTLQNHESFLFLSLKRSSNFVEIGPEMGSKSNTFFQDESGNSVSKILEFLGIGMKKKKR